jgi:DNA-binding transcriptional MerR regulator
MRISEVSRRTGVSIRSLRYYEQKRLLCARRLENGYRDLDEEAVKRVQTIQMYLGLGLSTEQIEEILACTGTSLPRTRCRSVKRSGFRSIKTNSKTSNTRWWC